MSLKKTFSTQRERLRSADFKRKGSIGRQAKKERNEKSAKLPQVKETDHRSILRSDYGTFFLDPLSPAHARIHAQPTGRLPILEQRGTRTCVHPRPRHAQSVTPAPASSPLPNPILHLGTPCAPVKLVE